MEIQPNSNIKILRNVPLDTSYDHTIAFVSATAQANYFAGLTKYNLTGYSYQRVNKGRARVGILADNLYDCNYMMFQNTAFGTKWFYAFIKSVEYVNNDTSEIEYEIDDMQTWWFDFNFDYCFVDREHSVTDNLYENLVPENLDVGDYTVQDVDTHYFGDWMILITASQDAGGQPPVGQTIANVYTSLYMLANILVEHPNQINQALDWYIQNGQEDAIITVQEYPAGFGLNEVREYQPMTITQPSTIDGYTPKNKKLFTDPYSKLIVTNRAGGEVELKWEQWASGHVAEFQMYSCALGNPTIITIPKNYRGKSLDWDSSLVWQNAPVCPFSGDAYKAYWAQHKYSTMSNAISSLTGSLGSGVGAYAGYQTYAGKNPAGAKAGALSAIAGAGMSIIDGIRGLLAKNEDVKAIPNKAHGNANTDYLVAGLNQQRFEYQKVCIRSQFARIIDDYFTRYGYATRRNKIPNINSRPHWNYVKTIGCTITGSIPADSASHICQIMDNGITFWKNGSEIGNYSLDNSPS